jgi:hypothetical protein
MSKFWLRKLGKTKKSSFVKKNRNTDLNIARSHVLAYKHQFLSPPYPFLHWQTHPTPQNSFFSSPSPRQKTIFATNIPNNAPAIDNFWCEKLQ